MQRRKIHDHIGLPFTEKDENDRIMACDLLIDAARSTIKITTE
jgi:hypothetical protein